MPILPILMHARKYLRSVTAARVLLGLAVLVILAVTLRSSRRSNRPGGNAKSQGRHVVIISIDGLGRELLAEELAAGRLPNIARLRARGSYAEGVIGPFPSLTAPAHAVLMTGRPPSESGIYDSRAVRGEDRNAQSWVAKDLKVPAIWDRVSQAHLTSAAISWPLAVGAPITWDAVGILRRGGGFRAEWRRLARWIKPDMVEPVFWGLCQAALGEGKDALRAQLAVGIIKSLRPNLLLLHFPDLDNLQHHTGYKSRRALAELARVDGYVGQLLTAVRDSGLESSTDIFIVSDHGFEPTTTVMEPNVLLAEAGLLTLNAQGRIIGGKVVPVEDGGCLFIYWPENEDLQERVEAALRPFTEKGLIQSVLDRAALAKLDANPKAQLAWEARPGAFFEEETSGPAVHAVEHPHATHGYLPSFPEMQAIFIAAGPGVKPGVDLREIKMTSIAPTVLKALALETSDFGESLAIFNPGCCGGSAPVWSGIGRGETASQASQDPSTP